MDAPVSNNACVCKLFTCMLYSAWNPSMKTSLITNALGVASHAEELSKSSNFIFSKSEMKMLNSSLLTLAGVDISLICLLSWNLLQKVFIKLCCLSFVDFLSSWWLLCAFCSWLAGPVRRTKLCGWNILNFECWEWIPTWPFKVNGHISYIL